MTEIKRRDFLRTTVAAGGAALLGAAGCSRIAFGDGEFLDAPRDSRGGGKFTFVHITDSHVRRKRKGNEGYARCIESINALKPKPAFALMGGDMVFDGNYTPKEEYLDQLEIVRTISNQLDMPYYACFGNHDKFGLSSRRKTTPDDPDIGPKLFMDAMGMKAPYYSFDFEGWHFVVLDSMFQVATEKGPSYEVKLGEEQLRWLARDLGRASGRPSVAVTHVAAFCNIGTINGDADMKAMSPGMVLRDTKDLRLILERHGCKALLQGHSHMIEEFAFDGVHYLTSAAASAAWWGGNWLGFEPGYTVFSCDGANLRWEHKTFAWEHQLEPEDTLEQKKIEERRQFEEEQRRLRDEERSGQPAAAPGPVSALAPQWAELGGLEPRDIG